LPCAMPDSRLGTSTITVNVPADGTYRVWTRLNAPGVGDSAYNLQVDYECPVSVGGGGDVQDDQWSWVDYQDGSAASKINLNLTAGAHTFTLSGQSPSLEVSRILLAPNQSCAPFGTGDNCTDVTPPTAPTELQSSAVSATSVSLQWSGATDDSQLDHYLVYRDGVLITSTADDSYTDGSLTASTSYSYAVRTVDAGANTSPLSQPFAVTTMPAHILMTITAPVANSTVHGTTTLSASTTDDASIMRVDFAIDGDIIGGGSGAPFTSSWDSSSVPDGVHTVLATASDDDGDVVSTSDPVTFTVNNQDPTPPTAPTGLTAQLQPPASVVLSWEPASDDTGVTGYRILRDGEPVGTAVDTSFTDTGLLAARPNLYTVVATDAAGNLSAPSDGVTVTLPDTSAPTAPGSPSATANSSASVTVMWSASADDVGASRYEVFRDGVRIAATVTGLDYVDTTVSPATSYVYTVYAYDDAGNASPSSDPAGVTTPVAADVTPPSAPTTVTAVATSETAVSVDWHAATDNVAVASYSVARNGVTIATELTSLTYLDTGRSAATTYSYVVYAVDVAGNVSPASTPALVTTPDSTSPSAPTALVTTGHTGTNITLGWHASTDNVGVTSYAITRNGVAVASSVTGLIYTDPGLTPGASYTYVVFAKDGAGNTSAGSAPLVAATVDTTAPTAPTGLAATTRTATSIGMSWLAATDNVGVASYSITRNGTTVGTGLTGLTYTNSGLTSGTSYTYVVYAKDAAGNTSPGSAPAVIATLTADTTAPTSPGHFAGTAASTTQINLSWDASTDNVGVTGYRLSRNGMLITTTTARTYADNVLAAGTSYSYSLTAIDAAGNQSAVATFSTSTLQTVAPTGSGFAAQYFNNKTLSGPATTRLDPTINFNWGSAAPMSGIGADNFSVRWTGTIKPTVSATYTLYTQTDDGTRLWVNNTLLIDQWAGSSSTRSATFNFTAGVSYTVKVEYFEAAGSAFAQLLWSRPGVAKAVIPSTVMSSVCTGLTGTYYASGGLGGLPAFIRPDATVNFSWGTGSPDSRVPADDFSARWTGKVQTATAGTYTFYTDSDDGVRVWVNNQLLIDNWAIHSVVTNSGTIALAAGTQYAIRIDYREVTGSAVLKLYWSYPGVAKIIVPVAALRDR
jgi:chitodextrinase